MKDEDLKMILLKKDIKEITELPRKYRVLPLVKDDIAKYIEAEEKSGRIIENKELYEQELNNYFNGPHEEMRFVLKTELEQVVGTATLIHTSLGGKVYSELKWGGIIPAFRNKKLSYPFLTEIARNAYNDILITKINSSNLRAIIIYTRVGFKPWIETKEEGDTWHLLNQTITQALMKQYNVNPIGKSFRLES